MALDAETVAAKIRQKDGNLAAVGRALGVSRQAVHKFVHDRPGLVEICRDCREGMKDEAESVLYKAVKSGQPWAVCFFLKTQAKDRGYVERTEQTGADGKPLNPRREYTDAEIDEAMRRLKAGGGGAGG